MASSFPGSLDNFTDPLSNSPLNSPSHSAQHADLNDAVEKVETYMGLVKVIPTGATNGTVGATGTVTIGSAVSSVTVNGAFSSLYDNYRIIMNSTGSVNTSIQIKLGSSVTGYYGFLVYGDSANNTVLAVGRANLTQFDYIGGCGGASLPATASVDVINPFGSSYTRFLNGVYQDTALYGTMQGEHRVAASYTSFIITPASGTLTGGTIRVYGYRN